MVETAAIVACVVLAGLTIFQLLLIAGQPLGHYAWGGNHKTLSPRLKLGSVISIVLYAAIAAIILERAEVLSLIGSNAVANTGIWIITAYFFMGIIMNAASRSTYERLAMTPVAVVLTVLCFIVARG